MLEREFQRKRRVRSAIFSKTTAVFLTILVVLLIKPTWDMYNNKVESRKELKRTAQELQSLQDRKDELSNDLDRLATDQGKEEEIRKKFAVAKEGETVVLILNQKEALVVDQSEKSLAARVWDGIWGWFK